VSPSPTATDTPVLDAAALKADFPILQPQEGVPPLIYLDNAATTQKPRAVIERMVRYYETENANVHRGLHRLAEAATSAFEDSRDVVARFSGVAGPEDIVFTRNATESLNLVARAWGDAHVSAGDEIVVTAMEHHSNLVPWQQLALRRGATLRHVDVTDDDRLDMDQMRASLGPRTRLVAFSAKSNVLGTENPVAEICAAAREAGARTVVDAAQWAPTGGVDLRAWGADFVAFSGHKMMGPMGVGVLAMAEAMREELPPVLFGGEMVRRVTLDDATWNDAPWRWEAGTPSVADVAGLAAAIEYMESVGPAAIRAHEVRLTARALDALGKVEGLTLFGPPDAASRPGVVSFLMDDVHPHDIAQLLDSQGIAVRAGHHCAQPLLARHGVMATARASFYLYNTEEDVDALVAGLLKARATFAGLGGGSR
jgi:cysteine desulfurase/selenocysteine lyase